VSPMNEVELVAACLPSRKRWRVLIGSSDMSCEIARCGRGHFLRSSSRDHATLRILRDAPEQREVAP
jgi:hypothetical protein